MSGGRDHRQRHCGAAVERLRQRLLVDGVMGGKPHVLVGKAEIAAGLNDDDALDRVELGLEIRILHEALGFAHRHVQGEIDLAGLDRGDARRRILDDLECDALHLRLRAPIGLVALKHDAAVELIIDQFVRAGADRRLDETVFADFFHVVLRHYKAAQECKPDRRSGKRQLEMHHRLGRRRHVNVGHEAPDVGDVDLVPSLHPVEERILEIRRGHFRTVVECYVIAEIEREGETVRREVPGLDQFRNELQVGRLIERLVEHQFVDRLGVWNGPLLRVPRRNVARPADRDLVHIGSKHSCGAQERRSPDSSNAKRLTQGATRYFNHGSLLQLGVKFQLSGERSRLRRQGMVTRLGTGDPLARRVYFQFRAAR